MDRLAVSAPHFREQTSNGAAVDSISSISNGGRFLSYIFA